MSWLAWSLFSVACWGVWGILPKLALQGLSWQQLFVFGSATSFVLSLGLAAAVRPQLAVPLEAALPAIASGLLGTLGVVALYISLTVGGRASVVIPITAAYPVLTAALSVALLREDINPARVTAIVLFVIATVLVAR